jgi:hypothetical protein
LTIFQPALKQTLDSPAAMVETPALAMVTEKMENTKNTAINATKVFLMCSPFFEA